MTITRTALFLVSIGLVYCESKNDQVDTSSAFMEAAQALFADKDAVGGLENIATKFMESDAGKHVGDMLTGGKSNGDGLGGASGVGEILSGLGNLVGSFSGGQRGGDGGQVGNNGGIDLSILGSIVDMVSSSGGAGNVGNERERSRSSSGDNGKSSHDGGDSGRGGGFDFESMVNIASMLMGQQGSRNVEGLMGFLPILLETFNRGNDDSANDMGRSKRDDHSAHSWFMPPVLENLHVVWQHFSNSDLGQTLWKNSGLANIVGSMSDDKGNIRYEKILDSFESPTLRRRWIRSLTNFVADWIAHISDPTTQQRYLNTIQFVGNSFLKSQGYPKSVMFDSGKPAESLSRVVNAAAKRHLNMQVDSSQYIKPAVAYVQDLFRLASEKGFIMSRVNANELSNRLSETINNDIISPLLKTYRAYKWAIKSPKCANHILCTINQRSSNENNDKLGDLRSGITRLASYPAAWTISVKTGISFWSLYGAIQDSERCFDKYPVDCSAFHEAETLVTTEAIHSEL